VALWPSRAAGAGRHCDLPTLRTHARSRASARARVCVSLLARASGRVVLWVV